MVSSPGAMAEFRGEFNIPDDVHLELAKKRDTPWGQIGRLPLHRGIYGGGRPSFPGPAPSVRVFEVE
ncbi:hypothetical protein CsSME_00027303 [Camellia sinensis var. sinensis]